MLASVTMCNDKIVELNSKINGIRWFGISYTYYTAINEDGNRPKGVRGSTYRRLTAGTFADISNDNSISAHFILVVAAVQSVTEQRRPATKAQSFRGN